jgi:hypothetical protein
MAELQLSQGQTAIIDDADLPLANQYKWWVQKVNSGSYYAITNYKDENGRRHRLYLHRLLMNPQPGFVVDHKDGNTLDNRRSNLRVCTHSQNMLAHRRPKSSGKRSQYRGVRYVTKGKRHWSATITHQGNVRHLGVFFTEAEAAQARDRAAVELCGEFAVLNIPIEGRQN